MSRAAVLLDRDGTLNVSPGSGWVTSPEDFAPVPGAFDALARLTRAGWPLCVVTNQSCIGRGIVRRAKVDAVNRECERRAREAGAALDGIYVCPHAPDDECACRKPSPGLLLQAAAEHGYDLSRSYVVGDTSRDLEAGRCAGATPLLVLSGGDRSEAARASHPEHWTFRSLEETVDWILTQRREG